MPKKPTQDFGHIAFGKDGSVQKHSERLPDTKEAQELWIAQSFAKLLPQNSSGGCEVVPLPERDHDVLLKFVGKSVEVQMAEIVPRREFLVPMEGDWLSQGFNETIHYSSNIFGVDQKKRDVVLSKMIAKKLNKRYASSDKPVWLLLWAVDFAVRVNWSEGGRDFVSRAVAIARNFLEANGTVPFSEIWFHYPHIRPYRIWPYEAGETVEGR